MGDRTLLKVLVQFSLRSLIIPKHFHSLPEKDSPESKMPPAALTQGCIHQAVTGGAENGTSQYNKKTMVVNQLSSKMFL